MVRKLILAVVIPGNGSGACTHSGLGRPPGPACSGADTSGSSAMSGLSTSGTSTGPSIGLGFYLARSG